MACFKLFMNKPFSIILSIKLMLPTVVIVYVMIFPLQSHPVFRNYVIRQSHSLSILIPNEAIIRTCRYPENKIHQLKNSNAIAFYCKLIIRQSSLHWNLASTDTHSYKKGLCHSYLHTYTPTRYPNQFPARKHYPNWDSWVVAAWSINRKNIYWNWIQILKKKIITWNSKALLDPQCSQSGTESGILESETQTGFSPLSYLNTWSG